MTVRHATREDLDALMEIYAFARSQMKKTGNPNQWRDTYPSRALLCSDIDRDQLYVLTDGETVLGAFVYFDGIEPTYAHIDGQWLSDAPYGVIHRVASAGIIHGFVRIITDWCAEQTPNLRIDTHEENTVMQKALARIGFTKCGTIYLANGDPRWAYQRMG